MNSHIRRILAFVAYIAVGNIPAGGADVAIAADWVAAASAMRNGDGSAQVPDAVTGGWSLSLEPSIWAPGLGGDVRFGTGEATAERFQVDDPEPSGMLRFEARHDDLVINASGFAFFLDENTTTDAAQDVGGVAFGPGDPARFRFDLVSAELTIGARLWELPIPASGASRVVRLGIDAFGGLRAYSLDALVGAPGGGAVSDDDFWIEPIVGARLNVDILKNTGFFVAINAGTMPFGDHTSASFDIVTAIQWRPLRVVGVQFGWRQIILDLEDGDGPGGFQFDGALAGIFGSVVIRF